LAVSKKFLSKSVGVKDYAYVIHLAPEVSGISDYSVASDVFACGITLYRLVNGDSYLPRLAMDEVREGISLGRYPDRTSYREFVPRQLRRVINKAMSIDPSTRFSSAEALRHALEQVPMLVNWNEQTLPDRVRWTVGREKECVEVERVTLHSGVFSVQTRKGGSRHTLRRINRLCCAKATSSEAARFTQDVLQGFVTGDIN
jgi:serine/threonine-protein kinase